MISFFDFKTLHQNIFLQFLILGPKFTFYESLPFSRSMILEQLLHKDQAEEHPHPPEDGCRCSFWILCSVENTE